MNKLIEALSEKQLISKEDAKKLEGELVTAEVTADDLILAKNLVSEEILYAVKGEVFGFTIKAAPEETPPQILAKIPEDAARYYKMVPLGEADNVLQVGMIYPEDIKIQEALRFLAQRQGFAFQVFLITPSSFSKVLKKYRELKSEIERALVEFEKEYKREAGRTVEGLEELMKGITEEAPVTRIVAVIIRHAVDGGASDIHIEPQEDKLRIRFRFGGQLYSSIFLPIAIHLSLIARIKLMAEMRLDETRIPQDGKIHIEVDSKKIDLRVSTFPTALGEKVALRVLDPATGLKKFEELGLESKNLRLVKNAISRPFGMILVCGPTGSGKTTTLYAMINSLDKERLNIVTLEDPVEYVMPGINQSQVRPEIDYDFAKGLRHILRQDPDVIMVGEIRDRETAALAVHAALTGHLMFSTVHANNVLGAIPRMVNLGVDPFLIPPSLNIIVSQRLVSRLCEYCRKEEKLNSRLQQVVETELKKIPQEILKDYGVSPRNPFYYSQGCKKCFFRKSLGRIAVVEVLEMTRSLANIIMKEVNEEVIRQEAEAQHMITMRQDGVLKALRGIVNIEEVIKETEE